MIRFNSPEICNSFKLDYIIKYLQYLQTKNYINRTAERNGQIHSHSGIIQGRLSRGNFRMKDIEDLNNTSSCIDIGSVQRKVLLAQRTRELENTY